MLLLLPTSVTRKFMTSLFMSSFDTLTCASFDSHASDVMVFLLDVGGMLTRDCVCGQYQQ
jgi:hypothetical protein